jgi:hypothetical protein
VSSPHPMRRVDAPMAACPGPRPSARLIPSMGPHRRSSSRRWGRGRHRSRDRHRRHPRQRSPFGRRLSLHRSSFPPRSLPRSWRRWGSHRRPRRAPVLRRHPWLVHCRLRLPQAPWRRCSPAPSRPTQQQAIPLPQALWRRCSPPLYPQQQAFPRCEGIGSGPRCRRLAGPSRHPADRPAPRLSRSLVRPTLGAARRRELRRSPGPGRRTPSRP